METSTREEIISRFEEAKDMEKNILETNKKLCMRVDYVLDLYSSYVELYGEDVREFVGPAWFIDEAHEVENLLERVADIIEDITFDDMSGDDECDPFKELIEEIAFLEEDCGYEALALWRMLTHFRMVRPYGEHFQQIRQLIRNELHAIEAAEEMKLQMEEVAEDGADED